MPGEYISIENAKKIAEYDKLKNTIQKALIYAKILNKKVNIENLIKILEGNDANEN